MVTLDFVKLKGNYFDLRNPEINAHDIARS
jgi:hypothetical protein